jgi:hypothetical protein
MLERAEYFPDGTLGILDSIFTKTEHSICHIIWHAAAFFHTPIDAYDTICDVSCVLSLICRMYHIQYDMAYVATHERVCHMKHMS